MENIEFFDEITGDKSVENKLDLFLILNKNQIVVDDIYDLSDLDIFKDYKILECPEQWIKTIKIKNKIDWYNIFINFKKPDINILWSVSKWHVQIFLYNDYNKVWYLNSWLSPQSWKIKFSGMRKLDRIEDWIANTLLKIYLDIAQKFRYQWEIIDYSQTTSQTKIDVAYFLQSNWYVANTVSQQNKFSIYRNNGWKICIYTTSSNKIRWDNACKYDLLKSNPWYDNNQYTYLWDVFIGSTVTYTYHKKKPIENSFDR